jgi:hypothetical protein
MASLFERINDNIGPYVFDTYSQSSVEYTTAHFSDGTSVTGVKIKETLTALTLSVPDKGSAGVIHTYSKVASSTNGTCSISGHTTQGACEGAEEDGIAGVWTPVTYVESVSTYTDSLITPDETESGASAPVQGTYKAILTRYCHQAIRDITDKTLAVNPKDMHLFCQNLFIMNMGTFGDITNTLTMGEYAVPWKDSDGGFFIDNNYILWVGRQFGGLQVPAHEISAEKGLRVTDSDSIYYSGNDFRNPVFYRSSSKIYIYPSITETETGRCSMVKYDEKFTSDSESIDYFPEHLLFLVVLYASIRALKLSAGNMRKTFKDDYSDPKKVWKTLFSTGTVPAPPEFPSSFTNSVPTDYTYGSKQVGMMSDAGAEIESVDTEAAENIKSVMASIWNRIEEEEEPSLVQNEIARFGVLLQDFNTKLQGVQTKFGMDMQEWSSKVTNWKMNFDTVMNVWQQYQQTYQSNMSMLNQEIQRFEQEYNSHFFPKHYQEKMKEEGAI